MTLSELSKEYRISGEKCRMRAKQLRKTLQDPNLSETDKWILRRRLTVIAAMERETIETSNFLKNYYRGANGDE